MKDITYNKKILEVIKGLSDGTIKQFKICKIDENISIKVKETSLGVYVDFTSPVSNFDFEGEIIGFAENVYSEFYKFFDLFKNPSLKQDANKLIMKEGNQTIKFSPSNPEIIDNDFKGIKGLPDPAVSFKLDSEQFSYIKKMIKMLNAEEVKFVGKGSNLDIVISNGVNENASTISIDLEKEVVGSVDLILNTTIFKNAPVLNYVVSGIPQAKMFSFSSVNEEFTLNLFTGLKIGE